jgi:hypothetical protein
MRSVLLLALCAGLAACSEAQSSRIDYRTFRIEGPGVPGGSTAPNRREAMRRCPKGYRVLSEEEHRNTTDRANEESGVFTNWTVRCL